MDNIEFFGFEEKPKIDHDSTIRIKEIQVKDKWYSVKATKRVLQYKYDDQWYDVPVVYDYIYTYKRKGNSLDNV